MVSRCVKISYIVFHFLNIKVYKLNKSNCEMKCKGKFCLFENVSLN